MARLTLTVLRTLPILLLLATPASAAARGQGSAVVRAVLLYSPTCPACAVAINEVLPPIIDTYTPDLAVAYVPPIQEGQPPEPELALVYGGQLEILYIDATTETGNQLYVASYTSHPAPEDQRGVPRLIVGEHVLLGPRAISEDFPALIDEGLASGGIDWPAIPGLPEALGRFSLETTPTPTAAALATATPVPDPAVSAGTSVTSTPASPTLPALRETARGPVERFLLDPAANGLAVAVMAGMLAVLAVVALRFRGEATRFAGSRAGGLVLVLILAGIGVSVYLTYIEATGATAVCGPVGDCNTVQQSPYAHLFGLIPVAVLGLAGYVGLLATWLGSRFLRGRAADWCAIGLFGLAAFGTLFSLGLTFLEPFVIGATCIWCLSSAAIMTAVLWLASGPGIAAWSRLEPPEPADDPGGPGPVRP